ncbi:hypothetical protein JCM33374_g2883 [Metschnikowia sp. JCM 33374]|nr:hypothetical protein JCM33374_g2883 [Metschnikowia sp. JCM 33374]
MTSFDKPKKQNVIFMVSDGMGPSSVTLARSFKQQRDHLPFGELLHFDKHLIGQVRTSSNDTLVTDSAAAGTAFSCGLKTYNGGIAVDPFKNPCGTVLEAMKLDGYLTGLVTTTRITDATPASLSAHVVSRKQEDSIAEQQLWEHPFGSIVDLLIGGGRCHFLPSSVSGGCRKDSRNLVNEAIAKNYTYVSDRAGFDALNNGKNVSLPLLGLLAPKDIPYDIDRNASVYPSLAETAKTALTALSKATEKSEQGFFILIEGARIDHCGHHQDAAAHVREVLAFDDAFKEVLDFIDSSDVPTILVSASDHETGGLGVARQVQPEYPDYLWYPQVLVNSTHSGEFLIKKVAAKEKTISSKFDAAAFSGWIAEEIFKKDLGILDYTGQEVRNVRKLATSPDDLLKYLNNMVSVRSQTGWTTGGHSGGDVSVYAYSNNDYLDTMLYERGGLLGNVENADIATFMANVANVSLSDVTQLLRDAKKPKA